MNKTKIWLIIGAVLLSLGIIISIGVIVIGNWDFTKLSSVKFKDNTYDIAENFENISVKTDTADIIFLPSESNKVRVECRERKNVQHNVSVKDNTLCIEIKDLRKWYEYIEVFSFNEAKIKIYLPKSRFGDLSIEGSTGDTEIPEDFKFMSVDIKVSTGNIKVSASAQGSMKLEASTGDIFAENINADSLDLTISTGMINANSINLNGDLKVMVSTGKTEITNANLKSVISSGSTGDITLTNVIAQKDFDITRSTGNVEFDSSDATELFINTDTGDITGNLLTEKIFICESNTGKTNVPKTTSGGRCELKTSTGDIKIFIK